MLGAASRVLGDKAWRCIMFNRVFKVTLGDKAWRCIMFNRVCKVMRLGVNRIFLDLGRDPCLDLMRLGKLRNDGSLGHRLDWSLGRWAPCCTEAEGASGCTVKGV